MKSDKIYLNYYQAMIFMYRIDEIRKRDVDFDDTLALNFEKYILDATKEMVLCYPQILLKIIPHANQFCLDRNNFNYLYHLTGVNPLDKKTFKEYLPKIKQLEEEAKNKFASTCEKNRVYK